jgi:hypothetical protein
VSHDNGLRFFLAPELVRTIARACEEEQITHLFAAGDDKHEPELVEDGEPRKKLRPNF